MARRVQSELEFLCGGASWKCVCFARALFLGQRREVTRRATPTRRAAR